MINKLFKKTTLILTLSLLSTILLSSCSKNDVVTLPEPKVVTAVKAKKSEIKIKTSYAGKLEPITEISISPKMPGKVEKVFFDVGGKVNQGDILFTLESKDIKAQIKQQHASVDLAQINLDRTKDSSVKQQLSSAEQNYVRAKTAYVNAEFDYNKTKDAYANLEVSMDALLLSEQKFKNAEVDLKTASENLELYKSKLAKQSIDTAYAQYNQANAALEMSSQQLDNTVIKSPISGIVTSRNINSGELASSGIPSFVVADINQLVVEVFVSYKTINKISVGDVIPVELRDGKIIDGVITNISPRDDEKTQNYGLKVKIDNIDNNLKAGMFAKVILTTDSKKNIVVAPNSAIQIENGAHYVYTVVNDTIKKKFVEVGIADKKETEIAKFVNVGDLLVTEGQIFLSDGEKVKVSLKK